MTSRFNVLGALIGSSLIAIMVVVAINWFNVRDSLPPPGSVEAFTVFMERLSEDGVSDRTFQACNNAFPVGTDATAIMDRLAKATKAAPGGNGVFYIFGPASDENDRSIWVIVEGKPPRVTRIVVETSDN